MQVADAVGLTLVSGLSTFLVVQVRGVGGYAATAVAGSAAAVSAVMSSIVHAMGAVCRVVALTFRLTVVVWAAAHAVEHGDPRTGSSRSTAGPARCTSCT